MKRFTTQILAILFLTTFIFAQAEQPKLIEEYELIPTSLWFNFLYGIGQQYQKENPKLLIKINGSKGENVLYSFVWGARMKAHFVGNMGFDADRIQVQNCDLDSREIKAQIYLLPENYIVPECNNEIPIPKETFLFSTRYYENPYLYTDVVYEIPGEDEAVSKVYFKVLKELLKKSPDSKIILIGYLGTNYYSGSRLNDKGEYDDFEFRKLDKLKIMKEMLKENRDRLVRNGISASIILSINGGYQDSTRNIKIWFVPKGGEIPKPKPDYFPKRISKK